MRKQVSSFFPRRFRNSQRGQTVILLAIGFIALAAFVGLVTDISIMFVRFSTLRRAVDSAALAAAGQIREGTDYGTVALSARQYIALHGLKPHSVWVETCETDIAEWRKTNPEPKPLDQMPKTDLCDWDNPKKLVRVVAQIESETTFLKLIGWDNFIITSSATSETAVLDIALVLDTSTSIGKYTTAADYPAFPADCNRADKYAWGGCCNDPGTGSIALVNGDWKIYTDANSNGKYDPGEDGISNPTPDNDKSDLVCQPFKQVKDAARNFIANLDFTRGDRVGLVTFSRVANVVYPNEISSKTDPRYLPPMLNSEEIATQTLNKYVGIHENETNQALGCIAENTALADYPDGTVDNFIRPWSYEHVAQCTSTNIGDGIRRANELLTNVETIRREAVWVAIILTDGAANIGWVRPDEEAEIRTGTGFSGKPEYGALGFCPWTTFCKYRPETHPLYNTWFANVDADPELEKFEDWPSQSGGAISEADAYPSYPECAAAVNYEAPPRLDPNEPDIQFCNDMDPTTRHFCLEWKNGPDNGIPANMTDPSSECGVRGRYDADDYARDMADWAGLIELAPRVPGNFIAMFAIGFGGEISVEPKSVPIAAPLLRYIADAGDNGVIDNTREAAWRGSKTSGSGDPCEGITDPTEWCGQYYYAENLADLEKVFEDIASRLFTRLSR